MYTSDLVDAESKQGSIVTTSMGFGARMPLSITSCLLMDTNALSHLSLSPFKCNMHKTFTNYLMSLRRSS